MPRKMLAFVPYMVVVLSACSPTDNLRAGVSAAEAEEKSARENVAMPEGGHFDFWDDVTEYGKTYHVARNHPDADDENPGTADKPFATIGPAAELLEPGQRVIVHEGIYREHVRPARGGEADDAMIHYKAADGEDVHIRASEVWRPELRTSEGYRVPEDLDPPILMADMSGEMFGGYNPFGLCNVPRAMMDYGWEWTPEEFRRLFLRRGGIYIDGEPLEQVFYIRHLRRRPGTFWVEPCGLRVHLRLPEGVNADEAEFEITVREQCFAPEEAGLSHIRVSGFHFAHAANPVPWPQRGMLSATRGDHWIVEDCTFRYANSLAMDFGRQDRSRRVETPYGRHIVRRNVVSDCGVSGLLADGNNHGMLVEYNTFERIGGMNIERVLESAGIKYHWARDALVRNNVFRDMHHASGVWIDVGNRNCRITGNVFINVKTMLGAAYVEVSHEPNSIDNNVFWGIHDGDIRGDEKPDYVRHGGVAADSDASDNVIVANNLFAGVNDNYAVSMHLQQAGRSFRGRTAEGRGHRAVNNIFHDCRYWVLLQHPDGNAAGGNLYPAEMSAGALKVVQPEPQTPPDLDAWRELGLGAGSVRTRMKMEFDPRTLELTVRLEGDAPQTVAVDELDIRAGDPPGPFTPEQWRRIVAGEEVTVRIDAGAK